MFKPEKAQGFHFSMKPLSLLSGEYRIRTGGLLHAMQAL